MLADTEPYPELRSAYPEMMAGCRKCPQARLWSTAWQMWLTNSIAVGALSLMGEFTGGKVEVRVWQRHTEGLGYVFEAVRAIAV